MLTPYVPYPPSSGGQIRTFNLLKYLSKSHQVHLVCLYKSDQEKNYQKNLQSLCKKIYFCRRSSRPFTISNVFKAIFSTSPFLVVRNYSKEARDLLKTLLAKENFDIIHAETFYVMPHLPETTIPIFLLEQTIEYRVYQHFVNSLPFFVRWLFSLDINKLKNTEIHFWKKATKVGTVSEEDARIISSHLPAIMPVIVPNGAGEDLFVKKLLEKDFSQPIALFVGNFSWLQNIEAAWYLIEKIYPIAKKTTNFKFIIAGQNLSHKLTQKSEEKLLILNINSNNQKLIKKLYDQATVFIAPIFGPGGTRLKILGAMATGLPIISTKIGVNGLEVKADQEVLLAETPEEFVSQMMKIIIDKDLYQKVRINAHNLVKKKYSWPLIADRLEGVYYNIKYENWRRRE